MEEKIIKRFEKKLNEKIPNQDFKYLSDYTLDGYFRYIVFESNTHPGRRITTSVKTRKGKLIERSFTFNDPGFNESDNDFDRMNNILGDLMPEGTYCIWLTGYFEDTPDTVYKKEKKVYPRAAFGVWIDPDFMPKEDELIELCKDCGVLALSVEYLPSGVFKDYLNRYDTKDIINFHSYIVQEFEKRHVKVPGKEYCFKKPFRVRKENEAPDKGYLKTELY